MVRFTGCAVSGQVQAICDLVASTNVASVTSGSWNCSHGLPVTPVCVGSTSTWAGVTCKYGLVAQVNLKGLHLKGFLPTSIGGLSGLGALNLGSNSLTGTIPSTLSKLTGLTELSLESNSFSGTIPAAIGTLTGLQALEIGNNSLSGTVPSALGGLSALTTLDIA